MMMKQRWTRPLTDAFKERERERDYIVTEANNAIRR